MRIINRNIVAGLIISRDNKVFMGKKDPKKGGVYCECWHIPGGGIDKGESMKEALIREIFEETGIDVSNHSIKLIDDKDSGESEKVLEGTGERVKCIMKFNVFQVDIDKKSKEISTKLKDDLVEGKWYFKEELGGIKLTPPSEKLFRKIGFI